MDFSREGVLEGLGSNTDAQSLKSAETGKGNWKYARVWGSQYVIPPWNNQHQSFDPIN